MQCQATRNGERCTGTAHVSALRLAAAEIEVLIPLHLCCECSAVVAETVIAYKELAS